MRTHRIAYFSTPHADITRQDIEDILKTSRTRNPELKLSGILIHKFGRFIQLLEGPVSSIEIVMDRIVYDTRHSNIRFFLKQSGVERSFERWAMWSDYGRGALTDGENEAREKLQRSALEALAEIEYERDRDALMTATTVG